MKKPIVLMAFLLCLALLCACSSKLADTVADTVRWAIEDKNTPSAPRVTPADAAPSAAPEQTAEPEDAPSAYPDVDASIAADCLSVASGYRELLFPAGEDIPLGFDLGSDERLSIMRRLAEGGKAAFDAERGTDMLNPGLVYDFFDAVSAGEDASLALFEVCHDGGFLRRDLRVSGGERTLTLTRLVWQNGEARVSLSEAYYLTELELTDGAVIYDYSFPDNTPGTNHDGHVDTRETIWLAP